MDKNRWKRVIPWAITNKSGISNALVVCILLLFCFPMILLRDNYIFTIFDNLDSYAGFVEMARENHIYFKLNAETPVMGGLPSTYMYFTYNIYHFINLMLGSLYGMIANRVVSILLGYACMLGLLKHLFRSSGKESVIKLLAVAYAVTPISPIREISFAVLPFILMVFLSYMERPKLEYRVLLLILYPLFSIFDCVGIFVCGLWLVSVVVLTIVKKEFNRNLFVGFLLLVFGYALTNPQIFITMTQKNLLNRTLVVNSEPFWKLFFDGFLYGQIHAPSLHKMVIMPLCFLGTAYLFWLYKKNQEKRILSYFKFCCCCFCILIFFSFIYAANGSGILDPLITQVFPFLYGFNYGRLLHFSRLIWYIYFAAVLVPFCENGLWKKLLAYGAVFFQMFLIAVTPGHYSDVANSVRMVAKFIIPESTDTSISYKEFFDKKLFTNIKKEIGYQGEEVVAVGYHPSVLMYNGFHTLDGYASVHPMKLQEDFRKVIAPELEYCREERAYYDQWGGRMYVFCKELPSEPTIDKTPQPVQLRIDSAALAELGGRYILSRAEIRNAEELRLELRGVFTHQESIYTIYVYENGD